VKPFQDNLNIPGIKGAYHRQCLGCHREWSHTTKCATCHELKKEEKQQNTSEKTELVGMSHPTIKEPKKVIHETNSDEGRFVTFYHDEHANMFGFKCVDCHQKERCSRCHNLTNKKFMEQKIQFQNDMGDRRLEKIHEPCYSCHVDNRCDRCHSQKPKKRFDHATSTTWDLQKYHQDLKCSICHGNKKQFAKLNKNCLQCHLNWNNDTFNHTVTGLILDETHNEINCMFCHLEKNYTIKPTCEICHEDKKYPKSKPGRVITKRK
jgi:hypothetical protein